MWTTVDESNIFSFIPDKVEKSLFVVVAITQ